MKRVIKHMKLVEVSPGFFYGESAFRPVCSECGCENLYIQVPGLMIRRSKCPECNHKLNWSHMKGGLNDKVK